jgi:hypothetical protein
MVSCTKVLIYCLLRESLKQGLDVGLMYQGLDLLSPERIS